MHFFVDNSNNICDQKMQMQILTQSHKYFRF